MLPLLDGAFALPPEVLAASGAPLNAAPVPVLAFALLWSDDVWLVDAGAGSCLEGAGRLPEAMAAAGIKPARVSRVILTHLHPDHVGGLIPRGGAHRFEGAEVVLSPREWADWLAPEARAQLDADGAQVAAWADSALAGHFLRFAGDGDDLGRGVSVLAAPGHRAGHLAVLAPGALLAGDIVHLPDWQLADPDRGLVWDVDPPAARATRRRLLALAADRRLLLGGAHAGLLRVQSMGPGFRAT